MSRKDPWAGLLDEDEVILWQGAPRAAFYWRKQYGFGFLAACALIVSTIVQGLQDRMPIVLGIAAVFAILPPILDSVRRRFSFFTLTNRRAFIGTAVPLFRRRLKDFSLTAHTMLEFDQQGARCAVYFAELVSKGKDGEQRRKIGFEGVSFDQARKAYDVIAEVRRGTA